MAFGLLICAIVLAVCSVILLIIVQRGVKDDDWKDGGDE